MKKPPKETPESRYLERLRKITAALEVLVDLLPVDDFTVTFDKLHKEAAEQYWAEKGIIRL